MNLNISLNNLSREELESRICQLEVSNLQLKNLVNKSRNGTPSKRKTCNSKAFDFSRHSSRHILLKFCYLGWDLQGFTVQENTKMTVESLLFDALIKLKLIESRETSNYHRCGRTDKGVSAFSQVVSITVRSSLKRDTCLNTSNDFKLEMNYCKMLNSVLPHNIRILAWSPAEENISARFDCLSRTYKYFFPQANLNLEKMNEAAQYLVGEKDFRNFCKMDVGNGVVTFTRKITGISIDQICPNSVYFCNEDLILKNENDYKSVKVDRQPSLEHKSKFNEGYNMCSATIKGKAFLWHQIRAIMTVLMLVGEGKENPDIVQKLLDINNIPRKPQYGLASEVGLNLYDTVYDDVNWYYDHENLQLVIIQLQQQWCNFTVKATMIHQMLQDLTGTFLQNNLDQKLNLPVSQAKACLLDPNTKMYKPLLERQTCSSLIDRVVHLVKKRRLDKSVLEKVQGITDQEDEIEKC